MDIILISVPVMIAIIIVCTISVSISFESMIDWKEAIDRNAMLYFTFSKSNERANVRRIDEHLQQLQLLSHCAIFVVVVVFDFLDAVWMWRWPEQFSSIHTHTHIFSFLYGGRRKKSVWSCYSYVWSPQWGLFVDPSIHELVDVRPSVVR